MQQRAPAAEYRYDRDVGQGKGSYDLSPMEQHGAEGQCTPHRRMPPHQQSQQQHIQREHQRQSYEHEHQSATSRRSSSYDWDQQWRTQPGTNTMSNGSPISRRPRGLEYNMPQQPRRHDDDVPSERDTQRRNSQARFPDDGARQQRRDYTPDDSPRPTYGDRGGSQRRAVLPSFNRTDLKYLKTTLEPSKLLMWRNQMQSRIRYKADSVAEYLSLIHI